MNEEFERLKTAANELAKSAQAMREADPGPMTDLVFALCSAVAGTLLDPGCWRTSLPDMVGAAIEIVARGMPDKLRRFEAEKARVN